MLSATYLSNEKSGAFGTEKVRKGMLRYATLKYTDHPSNQHSNEKRFITDRFLPWYQEQLRKSHTQTHRHGSQSLNWCLGQIPTDL